MVNQVRVAAHALRRDAPRIDDDAEAERVAGLARDLRDAVLSRDFRIPLLPEIAQRLLSVALDEHISVRELQQEIRGEPLIAAKVLQTANSSLYGNGGRVSSLHQAALRLGATVLRELLSQAVAEAFVFTGRSRRLLAHQRAHAVAVAHLTRSTCRAVRIDPGHAFLCGLFHDIGHPVLLGHLLEQGHGDIRRDDLPGLVELVHPLIGERIATAWGLPAPIGEVARYHHCFRAAGSSSELNGLVGIVAAADRVAYHAGIGLRRLGSPVHDDPIWEELGLDQDAVDGLVYEAATLASSAA